MSRWKGFFSTLRPRTLLLAGSTLFFLFISLQPARASSGIKSGDATIPSDLALFEAKMEPAVARPGEHVRLIVTGKLAPGWHIYSVHEVEGAEFAPPPTKVKLVGEGLKEESPIYEVNPLRIDDRVFQMKLAYHETAARFYQNYQVPQNAQLGERAMKAQVDFQACNDVICSPPKRLELATAITIEAGPIRPAYANMERTIDFLDENGEFVISGESLEKAMAGGLMGFLLLAAAFGAISLLTPCVFPMIPITVSFFTSMAHHNRKEEVKLALLFALGMIGTYTGLGLALTFFLGATGTSQFGVNPWVNLVVAGFFVVFAFSLIGAFNLVLPSGMVNSLDQKARQLKGSLGVIVMGLAFTATAFTCTVQFVGTLLIAALGGDVLWPILGMLVFSTVFALPFFLLALFPGWLNKVRGQSGPWMTHVKVVLGILELAAALKFLSVTDLAWGWGIFDREFLLGAWALTGFVVAAYIIHWLPWQSLKPSLATSKRLVVAGLFLLLGGYFGAGFSGRELDGFTEAFLPPSASDIEVREDIALSGDVVAAHEVEALPWHPALAPALAEAKRTGKPVFLDFTGYTCVNCRWMEKKVFVDRKVYTALKEEFVVAKLFTDGGEYAKLNQDLQVERFQTLALPFYVVLSKDNSVLARHAGLMPDPADFHAWLEGGRKLVVK